VIPVERSAVQWGHTSIPYAVRRSGRRGTVSIAIDPREGVLLTAPSATSLDRLDRVVRTKAAWIVQRLRRQSDLPPPPAPREFVSGETFLYLGRQYRLRLGPGRDSVAMRQGRLDVGVYGRTGDADRAERLRRALVGWYRQRAAERLPEIVTKWARRLKASVTDVSVSDQRSRWGSCDAKGVLRINWRIIQAPRMCIEYVVAHETTHVEYANHSPAFWAALGRAMPDYEQRRARLRELGPSLVW
jgi:predicted metal-dependent hydrolase